ncbi:MAG: MucB/RseB C-terminal domain-containing protein [Pseudomonadota bacterium]
MRARALQSRHLLGLLLSAVSGMALAQQTPDALLERISAAVSDITYSGTMIRSVDNNISTLRVMHSNRDGVIREKLVAQDGEGREVIRNGDQLICLFPEQRIKLIESDTGPASSLVRLPLAASELQRYYVLEDDGPARVAGRKVQRYFIKPRDGLRYGHRLWVDSETMLPLRMQMIGRSRVVEEIRFTNIDIGIDIPDAEFESDIDSTDFKVIRASAGPSPQATSTSVAADTVARSEGWPAEASPGFRFRATMTQTVRVNGQVAQRVVFSDGLATVSVFIAARRADPQSSKPQTQMARIGAVHSYQRDMGDKTVTLMGEVPEATLRQVADLAEKQLMGASAPVAED